MSGLKCYEEKYDNPKCYILKSSEECLTCKNGYNLEQGQCLLSSELQSIREGTASIDKYRFVPMGGMTVAVPDPDIEHCQVYDLSSPQKRCTVCEYGYFLEGNKCNKVSKFCDAINIQTGGCLTCKFGIQINGDKCEDPNCIIANPLQDCLQCR